MLFVQCISVEMCAEDQLHSNLETVLGQALSLDGGIEARGSGWTALKLHGGKKKMASHFLPDVKILPGLDMRVHYFLKIEIIVSEYVLPEFLSLLFSKNSLSSIRVFILLPRCNF